MEFVNKSTTSIFLTLIMLLSIGIAPVTDWGEKSNDEEERPIIDYSLLEGLEYEDGVDINWASGDCIDVLVVPVIWSDWPSIPLRYNKAGLQSFMDNDVSTYVDVATYGQGCLDFTISDQYVPLKTRPNYATTPEGVKITQQMSEEIRDSSTIGDSSSGQSFKTLAAASDILAMVYNQPGHGGQAYLHPDRPSFAVRGYNAFEYTNDSAGTDAAGDDITSTFLCDDSGRMDLSGAPLDGDEAPVSVTGKSQARCYKRADFLSTVGHELLHAMGVNGHGAAMYQHCHDIMGSASCAGPAQPSSWVRIDEGWYPEEYVKTLTPGAPDSIEQTFNLRPLNLNLLSEISNTNGPDSDQLQILKIPLSSEDDPINYLLVEYRPRITLDENGAVAAGGVGQADNLPHCRLSAGCWNEYDGLPSEGVMIYSINERWNVDSNSNSGSIEPIRVVDADPTPTLKDAAWMVGQTYSYGTQGFFDNHPYDLIISVDSLGTNFVTLKILYRETGFSGQPDPAITPPPKGGKVPTVTVDIWLDTSINNYDVDNADGDNDEKTGVDAVYKWHQDGDSRTPREGLSDPPVVGCKDEGGEFYGCENWIYARIRNDGEVSINPDTLGVVFSWRKPSASNSPSDEYSFIQMPTCPVQSGSTGHTVCLKNNPLDSYISYDDDPYLVTPHGIDTNYLDPGDEFIIGVKWLPEADDFPWDYSDTEGWFAIEAHACLDVRITPVPDEPFVGTETPPIDLSSSAISKYYPNNWAYENIGVFYFSKGSPYGSISNEFDIWNSFPSEGNFTIRALDIPNGINVQWTPEYLHLGPDETGTFYYEISLADDYPLGTIDGFDFQAWGEFNLSGDIHDYPLDGGLRIMANTVEQIEVEFGVSFDGGEISLEGTMVSQGFTPAGEDYSGSVVALEYFTPDGVSVLRPALIGAGTDTCLARFDPGSSIDIVYISPSGQTSTSSRTTNANGEYMDSFMMYENGTWVISFTYTDLDGNQHHWNETAEVPDDDGQMAPNAEGYDKTCGIGVFSDTFSGTDGVPLVNGNWNVRVVFAGDSIHRSTVTSNQSVRVEGMPNVHPSVNVGDTVDLEGTLVTAINAGSELRILYTTPEGNTYEHIASVDADNRYSDRIVLDEEGTWHINLRYMDVNRDNIEWNETIEAVAVEGVEESEESPSSIPAPGLGIAVIALMGAGLAARRKER